MQELPQKDFYKLSEVCQYTDTQPYVLRFWESEFPQLQPGKSASGQRLYRKKDIAIVCRIKELLYDEEHTLDDARQQLADELANGKRLRVPPRKPVAVVAQSEPAAQPELPVVEQEVEERSSAVIALRSVAPEGRAPAPEMETVPRQRYEDAIDEIDHLRLALREADKQAHRAEAAAEEAREAEQRERNRANKAVSYLERLRDILS